MSPIPTIITTPIKRACDSCHRRKVKCIGEGTKACKNCVSAALMCTYNAIPQKKGPKGSRAKVLSELREIQRQNQMAPRRYDLSMSRSISPSSYARNSGLVTPDVVNTCVAYFFNQLYATQPILHQGRLQQEIATMDRSIEAYCKVVSLCAYVLLQPNMILPGQLHGQMPPARLGSMFLDEVIRVRKGYEYSENPTIYTVYTSFFIFGCYFALDRQNAAWFHLRQATTLSHMIGLQNESTYKTDDYIDSSRRRRLFWALFMTERAYAFKHHRPLTLHDTIKLPTADEDPTDNVQLTGFIHLIKLFRPFDETFFGLWARTNHGAVPSWLVQLHQQLSNALPVYLEGTESQVVDLKLIQQWLKTMVWQLAISQGFVSSMASDYSLSYRYPIDMSRDLSEISFQFSQHAMEVHGVGFVEKLSDVACTLIDVMSCVPSSPSSYDVGPRDYLNRFISLISSLKSGQTRHLPLLQNKISEVLPSYQMSVQQQRFDSFGHASQAATPASRGTPPYDTPASPMVMRNPIANIQYPETTMSSMAPQVVSSSNYPTFSAIQYQDACTAPGFGCSNVYQTHVPLRAGFTA